MKYIQTWKYVGKLRVVPPIYSVAQWICSKVTGHEASRTEWGYGGGSHADVWCRWCNRLGKMPIADAADKFDNLRNTLWNVTGHDINQGEWKP